MVTKPLSILYIGDYHRWGSKARFQALVDMGIRVTGLSYARTLEKLPKNLARLELKLHHGLGIVWFNKSILRMSREQSFDWVWVDQGKSVCHETVKKLRSSGHFLVHYISDDFKNPRGYFRRYLRAISDYQAHLTPFPHHVKELTDLGARNVIYTHYGYDRDYCFPGGKPPEPDGLYRADVIYVGHLERHAKEYISHLIRNDVDIKVWGVDWERDGNRLEFQNKIVFSTLGYPDYARAIASAKIALGFLSRANRNQSTLRSFEIPAIGTFMLAERTNEHKLFYEEGKEAEFFESPDELLAKVLYYLENHEKRQQIARAGNLRALSTGYSWRDRIEVVVEKLCSIHQRFLMEPNKYML